MRQLSAASTHSPDFADDALAEVYVRTGAAPSTGRNAHRSGRLAAHLRLRPPRPVVPNP